MVVKYGPHFWQAVARKVLESGKDIPVQKNAPIPGTVLSSKVTADIIGSDGELHYRQAPADGTKMAVRLPKGDRLPLPMLDYDQPPETQNPHALSD